MAGEQEPNTFQNLDIYLSKLGQKNVKIRTKFGYLVVKLKRKFIVLRSSEAAEESWQGICLCLSPLSWTQWRKVLRTILT